MKGIVALYDIFLQASGVSTDTRSVKANELFFALKGPTFDGNQFAYQALDKGALAVVVDDESVIPTQRGEKYILVTDVLQTLQLLANHHRKQFTIPFIGITGSNGKTTTKELLLSVLSQKFKTYAPHGNLNNHIGVPLTILRMPKDTEIAIIEMGANKLGDIAELCGIAAPSHGLITNMGHAQLEGFGSFEGVLRGKTELFQSLLQDKGIAFINSRDDILQNMSKRFDADKVIHYGEKNDFYYAELTQSVPFISYKDMEGNIVDTRLMGEYNFSNILTALAIGKFFGLNLEDLNRGVKNYYPQNNRSQIAENTQTQNTLFLDAYNANPDSMKAALLNLEAFDAHKKKIAILGDMLELGEFSSTKHSEILEFALQLKIDTIITCGKCFEQARKTQNNILYFTTKEELKQHITKHPIQNSVVLLKGSRGIGLESLKECL